MRHWCLGGRLVDYRLFFFSLFYLHIQPIGGDYILYTYIAYIWEELRLGIRLGKRKEPSSSDTDENMTSAKRGNAF